MTFDPLSSQGIAKALRSGKMASFAAADFLLRGAETQDRYIKLARAEWDEYEKAKRAYYREEQRWPEAAFWARGMGPSHPSRKNKNAVPRGRPGGAPAG